MMSNIDQIIKVAMIFKKKIAQQDMSESFKMLNWIINDSPIQFGKKEAREVLDFLKKMNEGTAEGPVPNASKIDRIGAALTMYFYSVYGNRSDLHNHLVKNINALLNSFGKYKNMLNTDAENLVSRWENAINDIIKAPKGFERNILSRYTYAPGLAESLLGVANKLKRR